MMRYADGSVGTDYIRNRILRLFGIKAVRIRFRKPIYLDVAR